MVQDETAAPPARPEPTARAGRRPVLVWVTVQLVALAALTALFFLIGRQFPGDSDTATLVLQGQSVVHGHLLLHGWNMVFDSFWTVEVPFYAIGVALVGIHPVLMQLIPALLAAAVVLVAAALARSGVDGRRRWIAVGVVVAVLGLPSGVWAAYFIHAGWHVGTVLWALIAFAALRSGRWGVGRAVAAVFLAAGLLGDLQTIALGVGPVVGAGLLAIGRTRTWRAGGPTLAGGVGGLVLAVVGRRVADAIGTYAIGRGNPHASLPQVKQNVEHLPSRILEIFGVGTGSTGRRGVPAVLADLHVVPVALVLLAVAVATVAALRAVIVGPVRAGRDQGTWRLDDLLVLGCYADLVFFGYAALTDSTAYLRYLTPFVIFGTILAARMVSRATVRLRGLAPRVVAAALGLALVGTAAASSAITAGQPVAASPVRTLADFLAAHDLHNGLGSYWNASITTVTSRGRVAIRPVATDAAGRIVRYDKQSTADWYAGQRFGFLVYDLASPWLGVDTASATATFGTPTSTYRVGTYVVLVWAQGVSLVPTVMSG